MKKLLVFVFCWLIAIGSYAVEPVMIKSITLNIPESAFGDPAMPSLKKNYMDEISRRLGSFNPDDCTYMNLDVEALRFDNAKIKDLLPASIPMQAAASDPGDDPSHPKSGCKRTGCEQTCIDTSDGKRKCKTTCQYTCSSSSAVRDPEGGKGGPGYGPSMPNCPHRGGGLVLPQK